MRAGEIPTALSKFHQHGISPQFADNSLEQPFKGGQCSVYKVTLADQQTWAIRLPSGLSTSSASSIVQQEVELLMKLQRTGFSWSPRLIGAELDDDNVVGHPFMVYEWVPGSPLMWTDRFPQTDEERRHVLKQIARILLSLITCTRKEPSEPLITRATRVIDNRISRICSGQLKPLKVRDCFQHRHLVERVISEKWKNCPTFIGHGDLSAQNIIVGEGLNITGIIDWSFASEDHFEVAATLPRLFKPRKDYSTERSIRDRHMFMEALRSAAGADSGDVVDSIVALYEDEHMELRAIVLEAVWSKGAFLELSKTFATAELDEEQEIKRFLEGAVGRASRLDMNQLRRWLA